MNLSQQLVIERRQRLEAERRLKQRESELRAVNARLARHSVSLSAELDETRAETSAAAAKAKKLETNYTKVRSDLARANQAIQEAEKTLWAALQTVRDGFALFNEDRKLVIANKAYLSIFDGLEDLRPGIPYEDICRIMLSEGIIDPEGPPTAGWPRSSGASTRIRSRIS